MSGPSGSEPELDPFAMPLSSNNIGEGLLYSSSGRNVALMLALTNQQGLATADVFQQVFYTAFDQDQHPHDTFSRGYAGARLKTWPEEAVISDPPDPSFPGSRWYFGPTDTSRNFYAPVAAHIARQCLEVDLSPALLVAPYGRPRKADGLPPTMTRIVLYQSLGYSGTEQELTVNDLATRSGVAPRVIHNHLGSIAKAGIILPVRDTARSEYPVYTSNIGNGPDDVELSGSGFMEGKQRLARRIVSVIKDHEIDITTIETARLQQFFEDAGEMDIYTSSATIHKQNENIAEVLALLEEQGVIIETRPGIAKLDSICLTEFGREVIDRYLSSIKQAASGDNAFLQAGKRIGQEIFADLSRIRWLLTVDERDGAYSRHRSRHERWSEVLVILREEELSTLQVQELLGEKRRLTYKLLSDLEEAGRIKSRKIGRNSVWSIK